MRHLLYTVLTISLSLCLFCQCADRHDPRLAALAAIVDSLPEAAIDSLAAIDTARLSVADKNFHILLTTKARDKAFVRHSSDSLILKAVSYYKTRKNHPLYPEVLYYAGRVYNDMGDFPTSLEYYQSALEILPDIPGNIHLRGLICGHISWVLNAMRQHSQAIRYIKESLRIDSIENIGFNLAQDWQNLAVCYLNIDSIEAAEVALKNALRYSGSLLPEDLASLQLSMAKVKFRQDSIKSALNLVRGLHDKVGPDERNLALAYLAETYLKAGIKDSSLMYARELAWSDYEKNRKTGFQILLSDDLISYVPDDSLKFYFSTYRDVIDAYQKKYDGEQAVMQTSAYNYNLHLHLQEKAEQRSDNLRYWLGIALLAILLSLIVILSLLLYLRSRELKYYKLIKEINELKYRQSQAGDFTHNDKHDTIRNELREKVLALTNYGKVKTNVNQKILSSYAYKRLIALIRENDSIENTIDKKELSGDNPLWEDLESAVRDASPDFFDTLERLAGGSINRQEKMTAILIRCGVTPTQMSYLFRRKKGSISSRREQLGIRLFGGNLKAQEVDNIIRGM